MYYNMIKNKNDYSGYLPQIYDLYSLGLTLKATALKLDINYNSLKYYIKRNNLNSNFERSRKPFTEEEKTCIIDCYHKGLTILQTYDILKTRTTGGIGAFLSSQKLYPKLNSAERARKYPIDENFFDIIDSEAKAYILGFIMADGCNDIIRNRVNISIVETDKEVLENITKYIQPTKPIGLLKRRERLLANNSKITNCQPLSTVFIASKKICEQLCDLGVVANKSLVKKFPSRSLVPDNMLNHYIRGYFDGNGSISHNLENNKSIMSINSTYDFLEEIVNILSEKCLLTKVKITKENKSQIYNFHYGGALVLSKIREWLYKDATLYLGRKKAKFDSLYLTMPYKIQQFEEYKKTLNN